MPTGVRLGDLKLLYRDWDDYAANRDVFAKEWNVCSAWSEAAVQSARSPISASRWLGMELRRCGGTGLYPVFFLISGSARCRRPASAAPTAYGFDNFNAIPVPQIPAQHIDGVVAATVMALVFGFVMAWI